MSTVTTIGDSPAQDDSRSTGLRRLGVVVLLSLPSIVGTGFFLAGVIVSNVFGPGNAPDPIREFTTGDHVKLAVAATLFFTCYFGAAFGPLLLPLAALQAFLITRVIGIRSRRALWAWTFVVLGMVATGLFWGWLITLDIFI
jgi:hypothetical protein